MRASSLASKSILPLLSLFLSISISEPVFAQAGPGGTGTTVPPFLGGAPYIEAWVDPCRGTDPGGMNPGVVGCPDSPFRTLNAAITALTISGVSAATPGLVHANPGVYSFATNGELLPVRMRDFVNVQGIDAKRCVIRGNGEPNSVIFYPTNNDCACGTRDNDAEVLVELGSLFNSSYEEFLDGVTLQGGDVQIHVEGESSGRFRVSNSVFDMLHMSDVGIPGPFFGVLMIHTYDPSFPEGYLDLPLNILNNTFVMGWGISADASVNSRPESVAICDVNDPLCGFPFPDPDPTLRGVGNPNIQNNLIRYFCENLRTPLLGIDDTDTSTTIGGGVPTNAFDPNFPGGTDLTGTWCSTILGAVPVPAVNPQPATGGVDPAFVGEMLTSFGGLPFFVGRDWRLLPDSVLVDVGVAPAGGVLPAVNGTTYVEPALLPESSFDFDGEHYGNLRIVGLAPDIGFDETDLFINCAGYGNDTRSYGNPDPAGCPGTPGLLFRAVITPGPGTITICENLSVMGSFTGFSCGGPTESFSAQFGVLVPPAFGVGIVWVQPFPIFPQEVFGCPVNNDPLIPITGYVPPCDSVPHSFAFTLTPTYVITDAGLYRTEQAIFTPTGGAAVLTNMQPSYD